MKKYISVKNVIILILGLLVLWFLFRTTKIEITYYGTSTATPIYTGAGVNYKRSALSTQANVSLSNVMSEEAIYDEGDFSVTEENIERYRENRYYTVNTTSFDKLLEELLKTIESKNAVIKVNRQSSNSQKHFDKTFYPKYQKLEFTIDNAETELDDIEDTFKRFGIIIEANSNITSIEQELTNYEQRLKEIEESRKALKESKDKDFIAKRDANLAKESERIKNQIENAKKESTYKTFNVDIYEVLYYRVNSIRYWYSENYELKNAINEMLPLMVKVFAILIPSVVMLLLFIYCLITILRKNKNKNFEEKIDLINKLSDKEIHFDVKM